MKKLLLLAAAVCFAGAGPASAQRAPDLVRLEWITGFLGTGALATADFDFDASGFGGLQVARSGGSFDIDPSLLYGLRGTYRLNRRFTVSGSWMHSEGRYRIEFPAEASVDGNFDLEGLILAGQDFLFGADPDSGFRASSAMNVGRTDMYIASVNLEFPILDGWAYPYLSVGGGILTQKSDGDVIELSFETGVPDLVQTVENAGVDWLGAAGLSIFQIDDTDPVVSVGAGFRAAISDRWGLNVSLEDVVRIGADLSYINPTSTPPVDLTQGRLWQTTLRGTEGAIHNFGLRFSINYAAWPFSTPR